MYLLNSNPITRLRYHNGETKGPFCAGDRWLHTVEAASPPRHDSVTPFKSRSSDSPAGFLPLSKGRPPWARRFEIKLTIVVFTAHDKDKRSGRRGDTHTACNAIGLGIPL